MLLRVKFLSMRTLNQICDNDVSRTEFFKWYPISLGIWSKLFVTAVGMDVSIKWLRELCYQSNRCIELLSSSCSTLPLLWRVIKVIAQSTGAVYLQAVTENEWRSDVYLLYDILHGLKTSSLNIAFEISQKCTFCNRSICSSYFYNHPTCVTATFITTPSNEAHLALLRCM
jgi:hypothetical protein